MIKISDAVRDLVLGNTCLHFGLHHGLLNLSQVARFLKPMVEARTRKPVKESAIAMGLSRLQKKLPEAGAAPEGPAFYIDRINVHSALCSLTLAKSPQAHREIHELFSKIQARGGYLTVTEGITEITAILENQHWALVKEVVTQPPRQVQRQIAGLGVKFKEQYTGRPGLLYQLLQQLALQNINVIEVASTTTEFTIYLQEADLMTAFDSIYQRFSRET